MTEAYPLCWPMGWHRTPETQRAAAQFKTTTAKAVRGVLEEIRRLGGTDAVISTNVPLRKDGLPYGGDWDSRRIDDPGVAVYFMLDGIEQCIPCDKWNSVRDNLRAVEKTIEALRGIERWGAKDMVRAAFKGFAALPPPSGEDPDWWRDYLGFKRGQPLSRQMVDEAFVAAAKVHHPDKPTGSTKAFQRLQAARACALAEVT